MHTQLPRTDLHRHRDRRQGTAGVCVFDTASLDFGDQIANIGGTKTITVTNISKTETVVFEAGSSSDGAFLVPEPNGCSIPMPPGGSCALNVTFLPTAAKAYSGTLTFGVADLGV